jgi:hypothetical protein
MESQKAVVDMLLIDHVEPPGLEMTAAAPRR